MFLRVKTNRWYSRKVKFECLGRQYHTNCRHCEPSHSPPAHTALTNTLCVVFETNLNSSAGRS